jgi:hypothetical protein
VSDPLLGSCDVVNSVRVVAPMVVALVAVDATSDGPHGVETRRGELSPANGVVTACPMLRNLALHLAQLDVGVGRSLAEGLDEAVSLGLERGHRDEPVVGDVDRESLRGGARRSPRERVASFG